MSDPFGSCEQLIARAGEHIEQLKAEVGFFEGKHAHAPIADHDLKTGEVFLKISVPDGVPLRASAILFDIVNNLRSALDHAVFASAIEILGVAEPTGTKFPFGPDRAETVADFFRKKADGRLTGLANYIADDIQPYRNGRNEVLVDLNDMRNKKIHRVLEPVSAGFGGIFIRSGTFRNLRTVSEWDGEQKMLTVARAGAMGGKIDVKLTASIALANAAHFRDARIAHVVDALASTTNRTVQLIKNKTGELAAAASF